MTGWCGAPGAGWSPWRVVGPEFENHWAVSMQNENWIHATTDVLMPPNSQLGDLVCNLRRVLWVLWLLWEATKCALLAFGCQGLCAGKGGKKKNTSFPAWVNIRAWEEMKKLSPSSPCSGQAHFLRSKPNTPLVFHFCYETISKSLESCQVDAVLKFCLLGVWSQTK